MDADAPLARAQIDHAEGVVDLGGGRVVDAEGRCRGLRQGGEVARRQFGAGTRRAEPGVDEALAMEIQRRSQGTTVQQQSRNALPALPGSRFEGLDLGQITVGLVQQVAPARLDRRRQATRQQLGDPGGALFLLAALALQPGLGSAQIVRGGRLVTALALLVEVHR